MRAMVINGFGGPETIVWGEISMPAPAAGEVLVRVLCAGVNPADWKTRVGKLSAFIDYHFPFVLGFDFAGIVEAVGEGVDTFGPGDRVFGMSKQGQGRDGSYAEFCIADAAFVAPLPHGWSFAQAAALPVAGTTAYGGLADVGALKAGQTVLINGGAGGVGSIGIQIAHALGARVAATSGPDNLSYVRGFGADHAIDYRAGDVVQAVRKWAPGGVDLVLDAVGLDSLLSSALDIVAPGGRYVEIATLVSQASADEVAHAAAGGVSILSNMDAVMRLPQHLKELAVLCGAGAVKPPALEILPLGEAAEAHRRIEGQHVRGKIILEVTPMTAGDTAVASMVHAIDEIVAKPGEGKALLEDYLARYAPGARARGMTLEQILVSPPMWLDDQPNTLVFRWSLADAGAWWQMRFVGGNDPDVAAWWADVDARAVSRRRFFAAAPADLESLCNV